MPTAITIKMMVMVKTMMMIKTERFKIEKNNKLKSRMNAKITIVWKKIYYEENDKN